MDKQTVSVLRTSFAEIGRRRPDVGAVFYKRLFEVAPALRPMFPSSLKEQQKKLTASLAQIVAALDQPERLSAQVERLGQRHAEYQVKPAHYQLVGDVLLWTFQQVLQQRFTTQLRAAWAQAYAIVAKQMIAAAQAAAAEPPRKPTMRRSKRAATVADGGKRKAAKRPEPKRARRTKQRAR